MSKYENEPQYKHKFFVVKDSIIQQELAVLRQKQEITAYHHVLCFLHTIADKTKDKEYLVINQDEPYADKVWKLIKEYEGEKHDVK